MGIDTWPMNADGSTSAESSEAIAPIILCRNNPSSAALLLLPSPFSNYVESKEGGSRKRRTDGGSPPRQPLPLPLPLSVTTAPDRALMDSSFSSSSSASFTSDFSPACYHFWCCTASIAPGCFSVVYGGL